MNYEARNLLNNKNSFKLPLSTDFDIGYNDIKLNIKYFNKYFELNTINETLIHHQNEYKTRTEHLQKRKEALYEKEIMFKERILSYEMYIKELAMKYDRSIRRMNDEKNFIKNKQIEINLLKQDIEQIQNEKRKIQKIIFQYQPHINLLTQIIDQTDRWHSIDEMIEKFNMLHASYQDILLTIKNSNEELNDLQRQLLLTIEKKNTKISYINNHINELQQNLNEIQQRINKIQIDIHNYQQISIERLTEIGAINIAIESMFDLVQKYTNYNKNKDLNLNQSIFDKLKQIDIFLSDLIYYIDYVNNQENKNLLNQYSIHDNNNSNIKFKQNNILDEITYNINDNNQWRGPCEIDQRDSLKKTIDKHGQQSYFSYKVQGEDNTLYTIQINHIDKSNISQSHDSLLPNRSSISMILHNKEKKNRTSTPKLQKSIDTHPRSSIRSTYTILK